MRRVRRAVYWILALVGTAWTGFAFFFILYSFPTGAGRDGMRLMGWAVAALISLGLFWLLPMIAIAFFMWIVRPRYAPPPRKAYVDASYQRNRSVRSANDRYPSERIEPRFGE